MPLRFLPEITFISSTGAELFSLWKQPRNSNSWAIIAWEKEEDLMPVQSRMEAAFLFALIIFFIAWEKTEPLKGSALLLVGILFH